MSAIVCECLLLVERMKNPPIAERVIAVRQRWPMDQAFALMRPLMASISFRFSCRSRSRSSRSNLISF